MKKIIDVVRKALEEIKGKDIAILDDRSQW